jgi:UDP-glucose 4-epimerase
MEAVQTNVLGTNNVLDSAEYHGVKKLVVLSTDKAVYPINAMGLTKALMEKLTLARAKTPRTTVVLCAVRYGNVMYSRGSVIPLFVHQIKTGQPLTITNPDMTRLLLPLAEAVRLVTFAMEHGQQGDLFVRKAPAATVADLCTAMLRLFDADNEVRIIGTREGEKLHEVLVTAEEISRAEEFDEYYRVPCDLQRDYVRFFSEGDSRQRFADEGYTSENAQRLTVRQVQQLLLTLPEIQQEIHGVSGREQQGKRAA